MEHGNDLFRQPDMDRDGSQEEERYGDSLAYVNRFTKRGKPVRDFSRFARLMRRLGDPQEGLKILHVAGTNGKGSVVRMMGECLRAAGFRTGEYTSPYLEDYRDRIRLNGEWISQEAVIRLMERVRQAAEKEYPLPGQAEREFSQFEVTTALGFLYFQEQKAEAVCLETGIGGLADATNLIARPLCSVITSISYDHMAILGDTLEEIATQKAGIIKEGCPCAASPDNPPAVLEILKKRCQESGSAFSVPCADPGRPVLCGLDGNSFWFRGEPYQTGMLGRHQVSNAVTALKALNLAFPDSQRLTPDILRKGIRRAVVPARCEALSRRPYFLLDGAHNLGGLEALAQVLEMLAQEKRFPLILLVGMLRDKEAERGLSRLLHQEDGTPAVQSCVCVGDFYPNARSAEEMAALASGLGVPALAVSQGVGAAVEKAVSLAGENGTVICCGSLYLATQIRREWAARFSGLAAEQGPGTVS